MLGRRFLITLVFIITSCVYCYAEEQMTIATYYPAPYGVYKTLKSQRLVVGNTWYDLNWQDEGGGTGGFNNNADLIVQGNVGIGITNPRAILHVPWKVLIGGWAESGRISVDGSYFGFEKDALIIEKTDDDSTVEGGILFGFGVSPSLNTSINSPGWAATFQPVMALRGTGNVGIGINDPQYTLQVNGTFHHECPAGWEDYGHFCYSPVRDATLAHDAQNQCAWHGAEVCNVGQYYAIDSVHSMSQRHWTNSACGQDKFVWVHPAAAAAGHPNHEDYCWDCIFWDHNYPYRCCMSKR